MQASEIKIRRGSPRELVGHKGLCKVVLGLFKIAQMKADLRRKAVLAAM